MSTYIEEYKVKFEQLRKEIDVTLNNIDLVFGLKERISEPRLLMEPYFAISLANIKEKVSKGNEIKDKAKELVNYFKTYTVKYNAKDIKKLSPTISVRDIDYVFPEVKGRNSQFAKDYKDLEEFLSKCDKIEDTIEKIMAFDIASSDMAHCSLMNEAAKEIPPDVLKSLPKEFIEKVEDIQFALKAKTEFNELLNKFHNLESGIGTPPRYKLLPVHTLKSFKNDFKKLLDSLRNFDTRYREFIDMDLYKEIYQKTSEHISKINKRLFLYNFGAFVLRFLEALIPVSTWLLLLAPVGFCYYTCIRSALDLFTSSGDASVLSIVFGVAAGIGDGFFKFTTLLSGTGYYWELLYTNMLINPLIIQIIYTSVLVVSIVLRLLFLKIDKYDTKLITLPLAILNWIAITGLFLMPFILSLAPAMILGFEEGGWQAAFTKGISDGFVTFVGYFTGFGFVDSYPTMVLVNSNTALVNILFYAYIFLAVFLNIVLKRRIKRKLVRVGHN